MAAGSTINRSIESTNPKNPPPQPQQYDPTAGEGRCFAQTNPVCARPGYASATAALFRGLLTLDGLPIGACVALLVVSWRGESCLSILALNNKRAYPPSNPKTTTKAEILRMERQGDGGLAPLSAPTTGPAPALALAAAAGARAGAGVKSGSSSSGGGRRGLVAVAPPLPQGGGKRKGKGLLRFVSQVRLRLPLVYLGSRCLRQMSVTPSDDICAPIYFVRRPTSICPRAATPAAMDSTRHGGSGKTSRSRRRRRGATTTAPSTTTSRRRPLGQEGATGGRSISPLPTAVAAAAVLVAAWAFRSRSRGAGGSSPCWAILLRGGRRAVVCPPFHRRRISTSTSSTKAAGNGPFLPRRIPCPSSTSSSHCHQQDEEEEGRRSHHRHTKSAREWEGSAPPTHRPLHSGKGPEATSVLLLLLPQRMTNTKKRLAVTWEWW